MGEEMRTYFEHAKQERLDKLRILNEKVKKGQILFTGSSLMEQFPITELLMTEQLPYTIYNRGVGGFTTTEMLAYMEEMVFAVEPAKIFINIGTNDIGAADFKKEALIENYETILRQIKERLPQTGVYVMAYYPVNEVEKVPEGEWGKMAFVNRNNKNIDLVNEAVQTLAAKMGYRFINVNKDITDENGRLKKEFTVEGIHMYANAYRIILQNLLPYLAE